MNSRNVVVPFEQLLSPLVDGSKASVPAAPSALADISFTRASVSISLTASSRVVADDDVVVVALRVALAVSPAAGYGQDRAGEIHPLFHAQAVAGDNELCVVLVVAEAPAPPPAPPAVAMLEASGAGAGVAAASGESVTGVAMMVVCALCG